MTDVPYRFAIYPIKNGYCVIDTDYNEEITAFVENGMEDYSHIENLLHSIGRELLDLELPEARLSLEIKIRRESE